MMEINELIQTESNKAIQEKRDGFIQAMRDNFWGHSELGKTAKSAAMAMLSTKTGLFARVPITCKQDSCPYSDSCLLLAYDLAPLGEKCPVEAAMIETRWNYYLDDYGLDESSFTDQTLISELITLDIMLERSKAILSKEQLPITDVVAGMTESGEEYTRPEISKAYDLYERCLNKKEKILDSLLGTRKSRKGMESNTSSLTDVLNSAISANIVIEEKPDNL